jgi:hypothetical protein
MGVCSRFVPIALGALGLLTAAAFGIRAQGETRQATYRLAAVSRGQRRRNQRHNL